MKEPSGYYTFYKVDANFTTSKNIGRASCFAHVFKSCFPKGNTGSVSMVLFPDNSANINSRNNYCLLSRNERNQYLRWLSSMTGIKITKSKNNSIVAGEESTIRIAAHYNNSTMADVKFSLVMIRNLYEFPYNVQLKAAFLAKGIKELKHLDLSQRICLVNNSISPIDSLHASYIGNIEMISNDEFKSRYEEYRIDSVNVHSFYRESELNLGVIGRRDLIDSVMNEVESGSIPDVLKELLIRNYGMLI